MLSSRVQFFTESIIREMSRLAARYDAINLAQGMPDFETPQEIKDAACRAIQDGFNQYAVTWGAPALRQAIAQKAREFNGIDAEPDKHITVCCGATECMMATLLAVVNPGDEVIVFQPFYENYGPDGLLSGATPRWVQLRQPHWDFDRDELARAFNNKTRAIIINTPNNPTGKVFSREELSFIAELCVKHNVLAITDEIYEHIILTNDPHISIATLPGMRDRTVTISGLSKTFSVTGWRLGYCIAPEEITSGIRRVHDFLTVGAPHPLQMAGAAALKLPEAYYIKLRDDYRRRGSILLPYLHEAGFKFSDPAGAYYVMTDISPFGATDDVIFNRRLIEQFGVAGVPGSSFYYPKESGKTKLRFMSRCLSDSVSLCASKVRSILQITFVSMLMISGCNRSPTPVPVATGPRFLALGDSYTIGESVDPTERWPVQLARLLREQKIEIADPQIIAQTGWTTDELSAAIDRENPQGSYALVTLLIGVNNQYRGRSAEEFRGEFAALLVRAIGFADGESKRVVVVSIPDWGSTPFAERRDRVAIGRQIDQFNAVCKEECGKKSVAFVDITPGSKRAAQDSALVAGDGLHPSGKMYAEWAQAALPEASKAIRGPSSQP